MIKPMLRTILVGEITFYTYFRYNKNNFSFSNMKSHFEQHNCKSINLE